MTGEKTVYEKCSAPSGGAGGGSQQQHRRPHDSPAVTVAHPAAVIAGMAHGTHRSSRPSEFVGVLGNRQRAVAVLSFAACSSTMLVFNKLAVQKLGLPACLIALQMLSAVVALHLASAGGLITIEPQSKEKLRAFLLPLLTFVGSVFCNVNGLQHSNVETFVVFRCSTPIVASVVEGCFGDRVLPNLRSWGAMGMVFIGAATFVHSNGTFRFQHGTSQLWVVFWYCFTVADALVLRSFMTSIEMGLWSRAYWYNALSLPFFMVAALLSGELWRLSEVTIGLSAVFALTASTLVGFFISYTGFQLRALTSAASFLIVATVCKVVTITLHQG
eukprot:Hpha_TRINITY_DN5689_c0_g1::TRINITY_DN5689_c0_g1_i1::g.50709::m.50709